MNFVMGCKYIKKGGAAKRIKGRNKGISFPFSLIPMVRERKGGILHRMISNSVRR